MAKRRYLAAELAVGLELACGMTFGEPVTGDERFEVVDIAAAHAFDEHLRRDDDGQDILILCSNAMNTRGAARVDRAVHE